MWFLVEEHGKYHMLNLIVTQLEEFTMVWTLGLQNTNVYNPKLKLDFLVIIPISQASTS
jgi:hypothetical protein